MKFAKLPFLSLFCLSALAGIKHAEPIRIGYIAGLSGADVDQTALFSFEAMRAYFERVNATGGVKGRPVEVVPLDNKGLPQENYAAFERGRNLGVTLFTGVHFSNDGLVLNKLAELHRLPLLVVTASNPEVVRGKKFVARACFSDVTQVAALSKLSFNKLKAKKVTLVTDIRNSFSLYIAQEFKTAAHRAGAKLVKEVAVAKGDVSSTVMESVEQIASGEKPDLVLFTTQARESTLLLMELAKRGFHANFVGTDAWESANILKMLQTLGQRLPIYFAGHWVPDLTNPDWKSLASVIKTKFHTELSPYLCDPVMSLDSAKLIKAALETCPSLEGPSMMKCLKSTKVQGLTGPLSIAEDGESHRPVYLFQVTNSRVEQVVF